VLALVLDGIAVSFVYALVELVVWVVGAWRGEPAVFEPAPQGVTFTTVNLVYFAWCWTGGGSLGQRALRMYTLNASDASLLSWNQALLRWLYLYGPVAFVNVFFKAARSARRCTSRLCSSAGPTGCSSFGLRAGTQSTRASTMSKRTPSSPTLFHPPERGAREDDRAGGEEVVSPVIDKT